MVLLRFSNRLCVDFWFATTPAGIDIIIANEKLKATITNNALVFLLEIFLIALVKTPKYYTFTNIPKPDNQKGNVRVLASARMSIGNGIATLLPNINAISFLVVLQCNKNERNY